jgi:hypothetical protein
MGKHTHAIIATLVMTLFAFGSFPSNTTSNTSVIISPQLPSSYGEPSEAVSNASTFNEKGIVDKETRTQFMTLTEEHRLAMSAWQEERNTIPSLEGKMKELDTKLGQELALKPESPNFEKREWSSEDGKYKVTATLLDSDFKVAKLKKSDGAIVEVSKEKLSGADKQAIERAFAVIEVAARREKEWIGRLTELEEEKKEIQSLIDQANRPAPAAPTVDQAKQLVEELKGDVAAQKLRKEIAEAEKNGKIHPSLIEVIETRIVERPNASGEAMDMIECKFQNNSKRTVRIIDCTYIAYNKSGKKVLEKPYTLFVVDDSSKGMSSGERQDTRETGLFIPKKLEATSAKVVITKALERNDSKFGNTGESADDESPVARFIKLISYQAAGKFITLVDHNDKTIVVYVDNRWHFLPYQIRFQMAQNIWATWVQATNAEIPDHARIDIKDLNGNSVGGSRFLGGSLSWVNK